MLTLRYASIQDDATMAAYVNDLAKLIDDTVLALEHMDADALEKLAATAESLPIDACDASHVQPSSLQRAVSSNRVLKELLSATDRNLELLRRLRGIAEHANAFGLDPSHASGDRGGTCSGGCARGGAWRL